MSENVECEEGDTPEVSARCWRNNSAPILLTLRRYVATWRVRLQCEVLGFFFFFFFLRCLSLLLREARPLRPSDHSTDFESAYQVYITLAPQRAIELNRIKLAVQEALKVPLCVGFVFIV